MRQSAGARRPAADRLPSRGPDYRPLSLERRAAILKETLAKAPDPDCIRVFAYGSLLWNPCFEPSESVPALLKGYERHFCILTVRARGTPECPGLGPALVPGEGACRGIAYTLDEKTISKDLDALFEREMNTGVYCPTWIEAEAGERRLDALTFVVDTTHPQHCGGLGVQEMADLIAGASGSYGSCHDYLASMVSALKGIGGAEPELEELLEHVEARLAESKPR